MSVGIGRQNIIILLWNKEAVQFHFWKYINTNQTFILNAHRPFICSVELHRKRHWSTLNPLMRGKGSIGNENIPPSPLGEKQSHTKPIILLLQTSYTDVSSNFRTASSIRRHSEIWRAEDKAVLNKIRTYSYSFICPKGKRCFTFV